MQQFSATLKQLLMRCPHLRSMQPDDLGFKVLDEPSAQQSDAAVLELQLRAVTKRRHGDVAVRSIEGAHKAPQEVERWVTSIAELHRTKPPPQVGLTLDNAVDAPHKAPAACRFGTQQRRSCIAQSFRRRQVWHSTTLSSFDHGVFVTTWLINVFLWRFICDHKVTGFGRTRAERTR